MTPPIFELCSADTTLQGLLGLDGKFNLFPFGEAPEKIDRPYAVWQVISGAPENYLGQAPDIDAFEVQVDVYAIGATSARQVAAAMIAAIESAAHVTHYNGEWRESETRLYRYSFTVSWFVNR